MDFSKFIKKSGSVSDRLKKALDEESVKDYSDNRYWKPSIDKSKVGGAVIRFLPGSKTDPDALPYVKYFHHSFKNEATGKWYIEKSRTTLDGDKDPVSKYNVEHWDEYSQSEQIARKRKLAYVSNIYVINDPIHPENNGKVMLFKYGKKIFDKLRGEIEPDNNDPLGLSSKKKEPYEPWDYMNGSNLYLKIKVVDGKYWNYDDSVFDDRGMFIIDEDTSEKDNLKLIESIHEQLYDISEIVTESEFKPYEKLEARLNDVLGLSRGNVMNDDDEEDSESNRTIMENLEREVAQRRAASQTVSHAVSQEETLDEDDELAAFAKLAED